jgi:hypothetical protein
MKNMVQLSRTSLDKEMRELLMSKQRITFNLKGKNRKLFTSPAIGDCDIYSIHNGYDGMNVKKFGPTCITLYTYNILGKKSIGKIKYSDIEIIDITDIKQSDDKNA